MQTKDTHKSLVTRVFLVSLAALILCSILNWGVITGWGDVTIRRLTAIGDNGKTYSALMYIPKTASNENKVPGIMMYHGNSGSARNHESWAVEFSRRGFVCLAIESNGAGDGEFDNAIGRNGVADFWTQYLYNCPIVDTDRIVFSGHSQGGLLVRDMAKKYHPLVALASDGGGTPGGGAAEVDEGDTGIQNMLYLNGTADYINPIDGYRANAKATFEANGVEVEDEPIIPGKLYGSYEAHNASMLVEIEGQIHEAAFINKEHIAALLDFTQNCMDVPNYIEGSDQVWPAKDVIGCISMFVFAFTLCSLALFLIERIPAFSVIKQPLPRNIGMRGVPLAISITCAFVFPVVALYLGCFGLPALLGGVNRDPVTTPLFQLRFTNIGFSFVIVLNLFGALMFVLYHKTWGKKNFGATFSDYGIIISGGKTLEVAIKAFLLACITVASGWTYLAIQKGVLGTDFYCLFFGYKPIAGYKFKYYIAYMVVWALCFMVAAVGMCVERRLPSTGKEELDTLIAVLFNVLLAAGTVTAVIIIQNKLQLSAGSGVSAMSSWKTDITRLWGMPVGMQIGAAGNTYLYRKTGNIWLGAILMGFVCSLGACLYGQVYFT